MPWTPEQHAAMARLMDEQAQASLARAASTAATPGPQVPPPYQAMPDTPPVLPRSMKWAVGLMCAGTGLSVVYNIMNIVLANRLMANQPTDRGALVFGEVTEALIQTGLWLWMLWKVRAGRSWARVLSTVFFSLTCLVFIIAVVFGPVPTKITVTVYFIVALSALIMLYRRESSEFFSAANFYSYASGYMPVGYGQPWYGQSSYGQPGYRHPGYKQPDQPG